MDEREKLEKRVKQITKKIGEAKKSGDIAEAENLRTQRMNFLKQLADEHDTYYWTENGQSKFGTQEQMQEFYEENEEEIKRVQGNTIIAELFKGRKQLVQRKKKLENMDADKVKELMLKELDDERSRVEKAANDIASQIGEAEIKFDDDDEDYLEGIDIDL